MSSRKKSEGIALLSMYNDEEEDEDEEMEEVDEQNQEQQSQHEEENYREPMDTVAVDEASEVAVNSEKTPQSYENLEPSLQVEETNNSTGGNEGVENRDGGGVTAEEVAALDKFLPPPTKEPCPEELQRKINKFLHYKKVGRSFNAEVRNRKDYRNPDFLLHAVRYQEIDQIGSCFDKTVFDPHGYDKSDFFDEIEADMRRERERKEQELKKSPKVEFVPGGVQPGVVVPSSKFSMPIPAVNPVPSAADLVAREGRQNKKSKWDKVDGDARHPIATGGQDSSATAAAHAALLSAANVGAGYSAFVQQKRREAEEKKSSERKVERRS